MKTIIAIFFILHGVAHGILAMAPEPNAPEARIGEFFSRSWLLARLGLSRAAGRRLAITLAAMATIGFVATGLAILDILIPPDWWRALAMASAAVSLLLLAISWNRYLIVGIAVDALILLASALTTWTPE